MNVSALVYHLGEFLAPVTSSVSDACRKRSKQYLNGLNEGLVWAEMMADSTGKPEQGVLEGNVHSLGNFEECLEVKHADFSTHHCTVTLHPDGRDANTPLEMLLKLKGIMWGICLPSTCSTSDVRIGMNEWLSAWKMKTTHVDCDYSLYRPMDSTDWLAMSILIILGLLVVLSTGYDAYWVYRRRHYPRRWGRYSYHMKDDLRTSFSLLNNYYFLFKDAKSTDLSTLYGIRCLSMLWVVLGHVYLILEATPSVNYVRVRNVMAKWSIMPIVSAPLAVDTFLMMSGLLLTHKFLKMMPQNISCTKMSISTVLMFIHRYLRIAPTLAMLILLQVSLLRHAGSGPLWIGGNTHLVEFCKENWYWALLFVQNYVAGDRLCLQHSWYLNVDMQLFLLSPIVIIPLLYWRKWICLLMLAVLIISGFVSSFLVNYLNEFPAGLLVGDPGKWAPKSQYYYIVTHTRYAAYVIGIGVAYLLHKYKNEQLIFPFTSRTKAAIWITTAVALLYSIFGVLPFQALNYKYEPITSSAFMAAAPIIWTLGVGWIVFSCETNQCQILSRFLGNDSLQPLARLTYCIYLVHFPILTMRSNAKRVSIYLGANEVLTEFFGCYVCSVIFGTMFYLVVEGPFTKFGYIISRKITERWSFDGELRRSSSSLELTPSPPRSQSRIQEPEVESGEEVATTTSREMLVKKETSQEI